MKQVLMIDSDALFLEAVKSEFQAFQDRFLLYTAQNKKETVEILKTRRVDFIIAELDMPEVNGVELLSFIRKSLPAIPLSVTTSKYTPFLEDALLKLGISDILSKPIPTDKLIERIDETLSKPAQQGLLEGVSLVNFLQLVEMEGKTYLLEVQGEDGKKGLFYFRDGILYDAIYKDFIGEEAAIEMITWENVQIGFRTPPTKKIRRRINRKLMSMVLDSMAHKENGKDRETDGASRARSEIFPQKAENGSDLVDRKNGPVVEPAEIQGTRSLVHEKSYHGLLTLLTDIRDVKAACLIRQNGELIESAGSWPGADLDSVGMSLASMYEGTRRMGQDINLMNFVSITLESDEASIMCSPVGDAILTVIAKGSNTLGIVRQKVIKYRSDFRELLHEH